MTSLVISKSHQCIQLAHLYEHLFMMRLNQLFRDHGLYKTLDYSAEGTTFDQGGVIMVKCEFYTVEAQALANQIKDLHVDAGEDNANITIALKQIAAEEPFAITISDKRAVIKELFELDAQQWTDLDELDVLDTRNIKTTPEPITLTKAVRPDANTLVMTFSAGGDIPSNLLPLFNFLACSLSHTVSDVLSKNAGYYSGEMQGNEQTQTIENEMLTTDVNIDVSDALRESIHAISKVITPATISRIARELSAINYKNSGYIAPDVMRIMYETGMFIGSKGWANISTTDNVALLIKQMALCVEFNNQKISSKITG